MFERVGTGAADSVTILVDGRPVAARASDTVAAALLAAGILSLRVNAADRSPRGPYCLMGVCQDCRVEIDGEPDVQSCTASVRDGMRVVLGRAAPNG